MSRIDNLKRTLFVSYRLEQINKRLGAIEKELTKKPPVQVAPPAPPPPDFTRMREAYLKLIAVLVPGKAFNYEKRRFGSVNDGGYVMLDHMENVAAAYSLGIGQNVSWDYEIAEQNIPVFQFDDTIKNPPYIHPLFRFFPTRIGGGDDEPQNIISIGGIIKKFGHGGKDLILKMDIEGAEWEVLEKIEPEVLAQFRQIVCEFHGFTTFLLDETWMNRATRALANVTRFHRVIHVHANNVVPPVLADNTVLAEILEVTLVRTKSYETTDTFEMFPGEHDSPNIRGKEDICLGTFRY